MYHLILMNSCLVLTRYFFIWSRAGYGGPTHSHSFEAMAGSPASGHFDHDLGRFTPQGFDHRFKSSLTWFKLWPWLSGGIWSINHSTYWRIFTSDVLLFCLSLQNWDHDPLYCHRPYSYVDHSICFPLLELYFFVISSWPSPRVGTTSCLFFLSLFLFLCSHICGAQKVSCGCFFSTFKNFKLTSFDQNTFSLL